MPQRDLLADARTDLQFIRDHWVDLLWAMHPGSERPWHELPLSEEDQARADALARAERLDGRDPYAYGYSAAPLHVDVLDTMQGIVVELRRAYGAAGEVDRDGRWKTYCGDSLAGQLIKCIDHLPPAEVADIAKVAAECARDMRQALQWLEPGTILKTLCPWCKGTVPWAKRQQWTLRLYTGDVMVKDKAVQGAHVVCHNPDCDPPPADCGNRLHGRPLWTAGELDWLAERI